MATSDLLARLELRRRDKQEWERATVEQRRAFAQHALDYRPSNVRGDEPLSFAAWLAEQELAQPEPWSDFVDELAIERASQPARDLREAVRRK